MSEFFLANRSELTFWGFLRGGKAAEVETLKPTAMKIIP